MKKLVSAQAFAALTLAVAFPLAASANSAAQEQAFERLNQPLETQTRNASANKIDTSNIDVGGGQSAAMADALESTQDAASGSTQFANEERRNTHDWNGQSTASAKAMQRVNHKDAS